MSRLVSPHCSHIQRIDLCLLIYATGVWQAGSGEVGQAVKAALAAGYRHIDDAWAYGVRTATFS